MLAVPKARPSAWVCATRCCIFCGMCCCVRERLQAWAQRTDTRPTGSQTATRHGRLRCSPGDRGRPLRLGAAPSPPHAGGCRRRGPDETARPRRAKSLHRGGVGLLSRCKPKRTRGRRSRPSFARMASVLRPRWRWWRQRAGCSSATALSGGTRLMSRSRPSCSSRCRSRWRQGHTRGFRELSPARGAARRARPQLGRLVGAGSGHQRRGGWPALQDFQSLRRSVFQGLEQRGHNEDEMVEEAGVLETLMVVQQEEEPAEPPKPDLLRGSATSSAASCPGRAGRR